jgi:hypothetical protein
MDGVNWNAPAVTGTFTYNGIDKIGGKGCTDLEYRTHFSMWSILSSPLLAGNDLRNMSPNTLETLTNDEVIALNQDALGIQASKVRDDGDYEIFAKKLHDGSWGIALLNRSSSSHSMTVNWQQDLGVLWNIANVRNLWEHEDKGKFTNSYTTNVFSHEAVMLRVFPGDSLPVVCSSVQRSGLECENAVDKDLTTRWSSAYTDDEWMYVDLGSQQTISGVTLRWETAYGAWYEIQVSDDAVNWTTVYTESAGDGGIDDIDFPAVQARYVGMQGIQRGTPWGYSLWDFEVSGWPT